MVSFVENSVTAQFSVANFAAVPSLTFLLLCSILAARARAERVSVLKVSLTQFSWLMLNSKSKCAKLALYLYSDLNHSTTLLLSHMP